jgi:DNA-binding transcriptional LysR family regulator
MAIEFRTLEALIWVSTLGSFVKAAEKLRTTQPAISQRIAQLELNLGVRLLERQPGHVSLTRAGREAVVYAERLLALRSEMLTEIGDGARLSGVLRLGVAETIVHTWLSAFIEEMSRAMPRIVLEIEVEASPILRERLIGQQIDLAFLIGPLSVPDVRNSSLCTERLGFFAHPRLGLGAAVDLATAQVSIITFARNTRPYVDFRQAARDAGLNDLQVHASSSIATILRMARDGIGVALIPATIAATDVASGALMEVTTNIQIPDMTFVAAWRPTADEGPVRMAVPIAQRMASGAGVVLRGDTGDPA